MGIAAYAKHKDVSENSIRYALDNGRITCIHRHGKRMINPETADKEWEANQAKDTPEKYDKTSGHSMADARLAHQTLKAQLAKVELDERLGKLISADKAKDDAFKIGRAVRDAVLQVPIKISAEVASETDPHKVEVIMVRELTEALTELSRWKFQ